ncbi:hypothetical protein [Consotaella aegiceratis]|uniref:hypothetical protein n=1 Tax=Consotaella aegiceratis TaxID=3097961 RepID=UPI002F3E4164
MPQYFKDIIEELEPGKHQFFPMTYYEGDRVIGNGYWFIFGERFDDMHVNRRWSSTPISAISL